MQRDGGHCQWAGGCYMIHYGLEMAHIIPVGSGGEDRIENVLMLCKFHHDMHDGRRERSLREYRLLLKDWVALKYGYERLPDE